MDRPRSRLRSCERARNKNLGVSAYCPADGVMQTRTLEAVATNGAGISPVCLCGTLEFCDSPKRSLSFVDDRAEETEVRLFLDLLSASDVRQPSQRSGCPSCFRFSAIGPCCICSVTERIQTNHSPQSARRTKRPTNCKDKSTAPTLRFSAHFWLAPRDGRC
jgi:hypothetical protein